MYRNASCVALSAFIACFVTVAHSPARGASVQERHEQLAKLKEALADPDPLSRLASMEAAVASADATEINLAVRIALASDDPQMRGLAMRVWVGSLKQLTVDVILPADIQKDVDKDAFQLGKKDEKTSQPRWLALWSGRSLEVSFVFSDTDVAKGSGSLMTLPTCCGIRPVEFAISGTQLFVTAPVLFPSVNPVDCHFRMEPATNLTVTGNVSCNFEGASPKLPITGPMF